MFSDPSGLTIEDKLPTFNNNWKIYGIVYGQNSNKRVNDLLYGKTPISKVGCEVVAVNNALYLSGNGEYFNTILNICSKYPYVPNFISRGAFGTNPYKIDEILDRLDVTYSYIQDKGNMNEFASKSGIYIASYNVGDTTLLGNVGSDGVHTVAFQVYDDGSIWAYNVYANDTSARYYKNFEVFKSNAALSKVINIIYKIENGDEI